MIELSRAASGVVREPSVCLPNVFIQLGSAFGRHTRLIYALLHSYRGADEYCWPSLVQMRQDTGLSERTIASVLNQLERHQLITRAKTPGKAFLFTIPGIDFVSKLNALEGKYGANTYIPIRFLRNPDVPAVLKELCICIYSAQKGDDPYYGSYPALMKMAGIGSTRTLSKYLKQGVELGCLELGVHPEYGTNTYRFTAPPRIISMAEAQEAEKQAEPLQKVKRPLQKVKETPAKSKGTPAKSKGTPAKSKGLEEEKSPTPAKSKGTPAKSKGLEEEKSPTPAKSKGQPLQKVKGTPAKSKGGISNKNKEQGISFQPSENSEDWPLQNGAVNSDFQMKKSRKQERTEVVPTRPAEAPRLLGEDVEPPMLDFSHKTPCWTPFLDLYNEFHVNETGIPINFTPKEQGALRRIIAFMQKAVADRARADGRDITMQEKAQLAVRGWKMILENWGCLQPFHQKMIQLSDIYSKLAPIVAEIKKFKNENPNQSNRQSGSESTIDYEGRSERLLAKFREDFKQ